jgi:prepilin-type processing-associated H-X9-DG protein
MGSWNGFSSIACMLPFMEQQSIYSAINFNIVSTTASFPEPNATARRTAINTLLCPSDGNAQGAGGTDGGRLNSYMASTGSTALDGYGNNPNNPYYGSNGLFSDGFVYGLRDCTDGSSNTVAFGEKLAGTPGNSTGQGQLYRGNGVNNAGNSVNVTDASLFAAQVQSDLNTCTNAFMALTAGSGNLVNNEGQWWITGATAFSMFNTIVPPNSTQYKWGSCRSACGGCSPDGSSYVNASSNHSGGCNVLMGDGSVRFVKSTINNLTWWGLGTRANGEVIDASSF